MINNTTLTIAFFVLMGLNWLVVWLMTRDSGPEKKESPHRVE